MGRAHAGRLRVLGQAVSEVHASADVRGDAASGRCGVDVAERRRSLTRAGASERRPTSTSSGAASIRSPSAASWARCSRSFRRASRTATPSATISRDLLRRVQRLSASRSSSGIAAGATRFGDTLDAAERLRGGVGADRRAEVPLLDPPELPAERPGLLLHAASRPERGAVVAPREDRRTATTTCTRRRNCRSSRETADAARQLVKKAVSLHEQSLLGEVGRQRRDDQAAARRADRRRVSAGVRASGIRSSLASLTSVSADHRALP